MGLAQAMEALGGPLAAGLPALCGPSSPRPPPLLSDPELCASPGHTRASVRQKGLRGSKPLNF